MSANYQNDISTQSASSRVLNYQLRHANPSDSSGSVRIRPMDGNPENNFQNHDASSFNKGDYDEEEIKQNKSICDEDGKRSYIRRLEEQEKLRLEALNYEKISAKDKEKYMELYERNFDELNKIVKVDKKEHLIALTESLAPNLNDFLEKWGPKRCLIYLKLASVYSKIGNDEKKAELLTKAEEDLNQMNDDGDVSECRRWLYLQRIESYLNRAIDKRELSKEGKLLEKCWNVTQRYFKGRRDFLDFYTIFLAKHLLRTGDSKKAEEAYYNACLLRKMREEFWDKDDFDWNKLEKEVKKEIDEKNANQ